MEILAHYRSGAQAGRPAITRRTAGRGSASYVSTRLGAGGLTGLLPQLLAPAGVAGELPQEVAGKVELAVRRGAGRRYLFLVNRTDETVPVAGLAGDLLTGDAEAGTVLLPPRGVAVLRQSAP